MTPYRMPYPVPGVIWASLPLPTLLLDSNARILEANPAAETFLNTSDRALRGQPAFDRLAIDAPMEEAIARARANQSPLNINDVDVTSGERPPVQCTIHIAPMHDNPDVVMLILSPREIADRMGRALGVKSAARSAIGMAEMLAHEIKNPLAGISGAAQLLSPDREAPRTGGAVRQHPSPRPEAGEHPRRAGSRPQIGPCGLCRPHGHRRGLRPFAAPDARR
jgi:two-component system, NtrC family, nitrogen regulation sensor histidine kinase GlnL